MLFLNFHLKNFFKKFAGCAFMQKYVHLHLLSTLFTRWVSFFALLSPFNCESEVTNKREHFLVLSTKSLAMPLNVMCDFYIF